MGNIGEWTSVYESGSSLGRLDQVGINGLVEQDCHGTMCLEVACIDGIPLKCERNENVSDPLLQVFEIVGKTENGHDLGCCGYDKMLGSCDPCGLLSHSDNNVTELPVAGIHAPLPEDPVGIYLEWIVTVDHIVQHGGEQIVGSRNSRYVASEMKVDLLHGDNL